MLKQPEPCRCASPNEVCRRAGVTMTKRLWELCSGTNCTVEASESYRRTWDGIPHTEQRQSIDCRHRSAESIDAVACKSCGGNTSIKVYACNLHGRCTLGKMVDGIKSCTRPALCNDFSDKANDGVFHAEPGDPKCGLVLGSAHYPGLIELHVKLCRKLCGQAVPILISDDTDDPAKVERLRQIEKDNPGVTLWRNVEKMGHAPGDVAALWKGLQWAHALKLRVLCKLSNRFVPLVPRWLQDGARAMLDSGHAISSQICLQGKQRFEFRSEAALYDVLQWYRPEIMSELEPSHLKTRSFWHPSHCRHGYSAEWYLWQFCDRFFGGNMHPWNGLMTVQRYQRDPRSIFHCCDERRRYETVAAEMGVTLDPDKISNLAGDDGPGTA